MEKEFKEILEKTTDALEKVEDKVEDFAEDFAEDAAELWKDVKKSLTGVSAKLKTASKDLEEKGDEALLQAHLGTMEAHDKVGGIKDSVEDFMQKVSRKAQTELDTVALKAHLAKMEAEDFKETKGKKIIEELSDSSEAVKKLTIEAASEIKDYFEKLTDILTKKS